MSPRSDLNVHFVDGNFCLNTQEAEAELCHVLMVSDANITTHSVLGLLSHCVVLK